MQDTVVRKYLHRTTVYDVSKEGRKKTGFCFLSHIQISVVIFFQDKQKSNVVHVHVCILEIPQ